jgi:hypothetical protein
LRARGWILEIMNIHEREGGRDDGRESFVQRSGCDGVCGQGRKKSKNRGKPIGLCIRVGRKGEKRAKSDTLQHLDVLAQAAAFFSLRSFLHRRSTVEHVYINTVFPPPSDFTVGPLAWIPLYSLLPRPA